jgi:hypothetical protein
MAEPPAHPLDGRGWTKWHVSNTLFRLAGLLPSQLE